MSFSPAIPGGQQAVETDVDQGGARHRDLLPSRRAACRMVLNTVQHCECGMAGVRAVFPRMPRRLPLIASPPARHGASSFDLPTFDPLVAAEVANVPGIVRLRAGDSFVYRDPEGRPIGDKAALARFEALRIPRAWIDVWICPDPNGHIQAVGRDARGRKEYLYHPRWREVRDETKFAHMLTFGSALPRIRRRVERDIRRRGLPREKSSPRWCG